MDSLIPWRVGVGVISGLGLFAGVVGVSHAAPPKVQFSRQVLPVLIRECGSCHRGSAAPGGYSLESAERLLSGGRHGPAAVPGKSGESTLVRYLTGELKPQMPPGKPLALNTIALIRRWIDEGAKVDSMIAPTVRGGIMRDAMPMRGSANMTPRTIGAASVKATLLPSAAVQSAPVTALAYSPDGKWLAAGGYRVVRLLDPQTGAVEASLSGPPDQVLSVAWSADGRRLAAGGGVAGAYGSVSVWDRPAAGAAWSAPKELRGHDDVVNQVAWASSGQELATAGQDKTVRIWDRATGAVSSLLKDHVDTVSGVAYSPDGAWLATASADRTVKLYARAMAPARWTRVGTLPHGEGVTGLAFSAKSDLLATAAADRQVRVWPARAGSIENPLRSHGEGEAITSLAFSADGSTFAWGAINRKVRLWNGDVSSQRREMSDAADWLYAVAVRADGAQVAAGGGDGKVYLWATADGKLQHALPLGAAAAKR